MATRILTKGMTATDRAVAGAMTAGLMLALVEFAQVLALPSHFV